MATQGNSVHPKVNAATKGGLGGGSIGFALVALLGQLPAFAGLSTSVRDALAGIVTMGLGGVGTFAAGYLARWEPAVIGSVEKAADTAGFDGAALAAQLQGLIDEAERQLDGGQQVTQAPAFVTEDPAFTVPADPPEATPPPPTPAPASTTPAPTGA